LNYHILLLAQLGGSLEPLLQRADSSSLSQAGPIAGLETVTRSQLELLLLQLAPHAEVELELVQNTLLELGLELELEQ
jgi:hypothetical protein